MKTVGGAPHFLRVTRALAFVSLGLPLLVGCGGKQLGEDGNPALDCEGGECDEASRIVTGTQPSPDVPDGSFTDGVGQCECGASAEVGTFETSTSDGSFNEGSFGFEGSAGGPLDPPDLPA